MLVCTRSECDNVNCNHLPHVTFNLNCIKSVKERASLSLIDSWPCVMPVFVYNLMKAVSTCVYISRHA
jgi:hypothetical protein